MIYDLRFYFRVLSRTLSLRRIEFVEMSKCVEAYDLRLIWYKLFVKV